MDEDNLIHKIDDFFKGTHYCCYYYFLIESSCHVTFKANVIISHRNFFFLLPSSKGNISGKLTNLHLHYHANPLLALQAQIFIIPISSLVPRCGAFLAWSCGTINHVFGLGHLFSHFGHVKGQWQCVVLSDNTRYSLALASSD